MQARFVSLLLIVSASRLSSFFHGWVVSWFQCSAGRYRPHKNAGTPVILSEAKNPGSCSFKELLRSFVVRRLTDSSG